MKAAALLLVIAATSCARTPEQSAAVEPEADIHTGYYTEGFETREFRPLSSAGERWWVEGSLPCAFLTFNQETNAPWHRVYVELEGSVSSPGQFGHMGAYQRKLSVDRVVSCRPLQEGETVEP